ncbi:MAG: hypothetical protein KKH78_06565, partial [Candidatus Altiarchaeota archaeon]|nr:hypothetical protein [Candidatus Altiarchaeota archaeon]
DLEYCERSYGAMQIKFSTVNSSLARFQEMGDEIIGYANEGKGYVNDIDDVKITEIKGYITALSNHIGLMEQACENGTIDDVEDELDEDKEDIFKAVNDIDEIVVELARVLERIKDRAT